MDELKLFSAPLQGYTEAEWRHAHARICGGVDSYFTPFLRVEKGSVRSRDLRDIMSPLNVGQDTAVQLIFRDADEFVFLVDTILASGHSRIDLNMGCPFPPQVKHGRGAALLRKPELLTQLAGIIAERYTNVEFSAKMRIGVDSPGEWKNVIDAINSLPLKHLTVHPRIAKQQYAGSLNLDSFKELAAASAHPVVFNGDIHTPADIDTATSLGRLHGIMAGRGLLGRPSLFAEWREGGEWSIDRRLEALAAIHNTILENYAGRLCGDSQLLSKIKPFWDYAGDTIGRNVAKAIRKAGNMPAYRAAIREIGC